MALYDLHKPYNHSPQIYNITVLEYIQEACINKNNWNKILTLSQVDKISSTIMK